MLRRDYVESKGDVPFGKIVDSCMMTRRSDSFCLIHTFGFSGLDWYQVDGQALIEPAVYLLIVSPSGEVRTLRDADIGLDVLPAYWHERTGEELFALGQPFAFGGEEPKVKLRYSLNDSRVKNAAMKRRLYHLQRSELLWESLDYYVSGHQHRINDESLLLIIAPSGAHRLLRDRARGIDVLPENWATMTGEALFDLALPCGGELPADGGRSSEGAGAGVAAQAEAQPERAIADASESEDAGDTTVTAARRELVISVAAKNNEPAFEVPDFAAIARKAARERVEHLRSVRDAIGWPFV